MKQTFSFMLFVWLGIFPLHAFGQSTTLDGEKSSFDIQYILQSLTDSAEIAKLTVIKDFEEKNSIQRSEAEFFDLKSIEAHLEKLDVYMAVIERLALIPNSLLLNTTPQLINDLIQYVKLEIEDTLGYLASYERSLVFKSRGQMIIGNFISAIFHNNLKDFPVPVKNLRWIVYSRVHTSAKRVTDNLKSLSASFVCNQIFVPAH